MKQQLEYYQARLRVDKDNLDEELSNFPAAFYTVSDFYVDADRRVKRLEHRLARERASIASALRNVAREEGTNVTETQLKQEVQLHPRVSKMEVKLAQAQKEAKRWETLKEAMVQKSFSLKGLVSLSMHENFQRSTASMEDSRATHRKRRGRN